MTVKELKNQSKTFFDIFKQSITTEERDYTKMGLRRAVFMLAIPTILEMLMESAFSLFDMIFVGRISKEAVTTVGLTENMMFILYSVGMGISIAASAIIARRIGEKDKHAAGTAAMQAVWIMLVISAVIATLGIIYAPDLLRLMGAEELVISMGAGYTRILLGGNTAVLMLFLINGIFRGGGDASIAMRTLVLANTINIVLDPILIFGLPFLGWEGFGIEGAAIATTLGRSIGIVYQIKMLGKGKANLVIRRSNLKFEKATTRSILKISIGSIGQFLVESASWVFITRLIADFGTLAVAGYTVAIRVVIVTILPFFGMANAAATLVGQNLGANQPERAEKSAWFAANLSAGIMAGLSLIYVVFAPQILSILSADADVVALGTKYLRIICIGYLFFAYGMVISQSINGAGDTVTPTWLNIIAFWVIQIPLGWVLANVIGMEAMGGVLAVTIAFSVHAVLSIAIFRRGKWKSTTL